MAAEPPAMDTGLADQLVVACGPDPENDNAGETPRAVACPEFVTVTCAVNAWPRLIVAGVSVRAVTASAAGVWTGAAAEERGEAWRCAPLLAAGPEACTEKASVPVPAPFSVHDQSNPAVPPAPTDADATVAVQLAAAWPVTD